MEQVLNYVPIALDIIVVVFFVMCVMQGYKEGLSRCMRSVGEFLALILSALIAIDLAPYCQVASDFMVKVGNAIGVDSHMVITVMKFAIPITLFIIFFTALLAVWRFVTDKTDKLAMKKGMQSLDKVGGIIIELVMAVVIVALIGWVLYDLTGLISTEIIDGTVVVSTILNIL